MWGRCCDAGVVAGLILLVDYANLCLIRAGRRTIDGDGHIDSDSHFLPDGRGGGYCVSLVKALMRHRLAECQQRCAKR